MYRTHDRGQSLIEILFAITIFTIGFLTIGYLIIDSFTSLRYATESTQARLLASEGIEAIGALRDGSFDAVPAGTYGLDRRGGKWVLIETPDTHEKFTRTIIIRDLDTENKEVTSRVSWEFANGNEKQIILSAQLSNWMQTGGEAGDLSVDLSHLTRSASGTEISGIVLNHNGVKNILISGVTAAWDSPALLDQLMIGGTAVVEASSSPILPDTALTVSNYEILPYTASSMVLGFDRDVSSTELLITIILHDGSKKYVRITP